MIGGFSDISKILLPIAQTAIPAIINKVLDSSTTKGDFTPPTAYYQPPAQPATCEVSVESKEDGQTIKRGDINLNVDVTVFAVTDPGCIEKIKDMNFSKTFEGCM